MGDWIAGKLEIIFLLMVVIDWDVFMDSESSDRAEVVVDCSCSWAYGWRGWSSGYDSGETDSGCCCFMLSGGIDWEDGEDEDVVDM